MTALTAFVLGLVLVAAGVILLKRSRIKTYGNHCPNMGACNNCDWKDECP